MYDKPSLVAALNGLLSSLSIAMRYGASSMKRAEDPKRTGSESACVVSTKLACESLAMYALRSEGRSGSICKTERQPKPTVLNNSVLTGT